MSSGKKFNAFSGVFTPSILTILGVIMYMRLGWVVGQAGLIGTLVIILLAHVISLTTGLSISSIATDKKVKTGGIYYMLSRSLGLPMGGAIGLALFIGTALGISLYIVGFAENFLGIEAIRNFLGLGTNLNAIRLVGTAVVVLLTILGLISTSLVIKTQYFILTAIGLSLVSIFVGFLWEPASNPDTILLFPAKSSDAMSVVFAVFFPAVTGFTAGVAMSGDLRNPGKDIPRGTIAAIITGLVVYIALTLVMVMFMPRNTLLQDNNFLMKSAWIGGLVIAGIWGATLSSAMGGLLGGPRIMQAIAMDKIMPRFLAKGQGGSNEPRVALIFTFLIAEAGILIGDLNVIAELVSMFYLTSYGFINLAYVLEGWASADFRPSLRIPNWVGVVGFIATFAVMFQLNPLAMIIALVLMLGIYFLLKRRELQLDFGDVWQSVWSSMARSSLYRMDRKGIEERNWRPNIILFSGGTQSRPHLIEFGKSLVGKHGLLSNFDLVETDNSAEEVLPKHQQTDASRDPEISTQGIFLRRHTCKNVYEGIENVAQNYGFSGVDPNTVLMGWARQTKNPARFAQMLKLLNKLDMNILMMDYDPRKGFGNYKIIDIWWRGGANNSHLAIQLIKFLWISEKWKNAQLRLMIINPVNKQKEFIRRETEQVLEELRIKAEIKIINNEIENKSLYDIIRVESINSDLIFLGLPLLKDGNEDEFIRNTSDLCRDIGTVVLVKASSSIKPIELKADIQKIRRSQASNRVARVVKLSMNVPELSLPRKEKPAQYLEEFKNEVLRHFEKLDKNAFLSINEENQESLKKLRKIIHDTARKVNSAKGLESEYERNKRLLKVKQNMLTSIGNEIIRLRDKQIIRQKDMIAKASSEFLNEIQDTLNKQPNSLRIKLESYDLEIKPGDSIPLRLFKKRKKLSRKLWGKQPTTRIEFKALLEEQFPMTAHKLLNSTLEKWGLISGQFVVELQKTVEKLNSSFQGLIFRKNNGEAADDEELRRQLLKDALESIRNLSDAQNQSAEGLLPEAQKMIISSLQETAYKIDLMTGKMSTDEDSEDQQKLLKRTTRWLAGLPAKWQKNQHLFLNGAVLETYLLTFSTRIQIIFNDITHETEIKLDKHTLEKQTKLHDRIQNLMLQKFDGQDLLEDESELESNINYYNFFQGMLDSAKKRIRLGSRIFPNSILLMSEESFNEFHDRQYSRVHSIKLSVNHFLDYLIQNELIAPLENITKKLPEDITRNNKAVREIIRLLDFTINEKKEEYSDDQLTDYIHKQSTQMEQVIKQTQLLRDESLLQLKERVSSFNENLQFHIFRHKAIHSKKYSRSTEVERPVVKFRKRLNMSWNYIIRLISLFYYNRGKGILLAKNAHQQIDKQQARVEDMLDIAEASQGAPEVINNLPFYYRQLFLRKQNYLNDFWVGREEQLEQAERALKRYRSGQHGALLITGEQYSGKTFMAQYLINKLLYKSNLVIVTPPHAGSIQAFDFKQAIISATDRNGEYDEIFSDLPSNSVILFDDIDLWWEKSDEGMRIINLILNLIRRHSRNYIFMITIDKHAFTLINRMNKIESFFLSLIECTPMNSDELRRAIMQRHEAGNLTFKLGKRTESNIRPWVQARLFSRYFSYSRGNVGIALRSWINHITHFSNGMITISEPRLPDLMKLNYLESHWYITLLQIVLHRRVTSKKLSRVLRVSEQEAIKKIEILYLAGLIRENGKNVYEINPVVYPHLMVKLNEMKII